MSSSVAGEVSPPLVEVAGGAMRCECVWPAGVRSSGLRADGDNTEQWDWQQWLLLAEALTMRPCCPSATHCSPLVEAPIQLASKNPFPCSVAGLTLSHWSLGNHSGLTQRSSSCELCCTFMRTCLERACGHLV